MNAEDQRYMIDKASELAACEEEVFLEVDGIGSLNVRECSIVNEQPSLAQIECWQDGDAPGQTVFVPLARVLQLRVQERQARER